MDKPQFAYVTYINATPEKVWQALTTPEFTERYWSGRRVESDWRVGSPIRFMTHDGRLPTPARSSRPIRRGGSPSPGGWSSRKNSAARAIRA